MGSININYEGKTESHEMEQLPETSGGNTTELENKVDQLINNLTIIKGTLEAGGTQITIENERIRAANDCALTFYASIYGISPEEVIVEDGKVTLTFDAQDTDMVVGVRIDA